MLEIPSGNFCTGPLVDGSELSPVAGLSHRLRSRKYRWIVSTAMSASSPAAECSSALVSNATASLPNGSLGQIGAVAEPVGQGGTRVDQLSDVDRLDRCRVVAQVLLDDVDGYPGQIVA